MAMTPTKATDPHMTPSKLARLTALMILPCLPQIGFAQDVADIIVALDAGNWENEQTVRMGGVEVPQANGRSRECLNEAEAILTVGDYIQTFLAGVGPDLNCTITDLRGTQGDITADVSCSGAQGSATDMTMHYEYQPRLVEVSAEGWSSYAGQTVPFTVVGSTRYVGACP